MNIFVRLFAAVSALAAAGSASAQPDFFGGVSPTQGHDLITKLQTLQRQLAEGKSEFFELHSGGPIGLRMTQISPRQAFLEMPFDDVLTVSRDGRRASGRYTVVVNHKAHKLFCTLSVRVRPPENRIWAVNIDCAGPPPGLPPPPPPASEGAAEREHSNRSLAESFRPIGGSPKSSLLLVSSSLSAVPASADAA